MTGAPLHEDMEDRVHSLLEGLIPE